MMLPSEPIYVVDTVALVRYLTNAKLLGSEARRVMHSAASGHGILMLSAVAIAEAYYANAKHGWFADFNQVYKELQAAPHVQMVPFEADEVLDFDHLAVVPEMHDRIITGLAWRLGVPVITNDPQIVGSGLVPTLW